MRRYRYSSLPVLASLLLTVISCEKDNPVDPEPEPEPVATEVVSIPAVSGISASGASFSSVYSGSSIVDKSGFCWSKSQNPSLSDKSVSCSSGSFSATASGLEARTTYYVKAYVFESGSKYPTYSKETSFTTSESTDPSEYKAPTYVDNYVSLAGWENRSKWNLANVHDPSVMLAEDGYYYMYQTDASYGNAHEGHGHFHCRRSKNLVDWEYLGSTMDTTPSWVLTKVNDLRKAQGLASITEPSYGYWAPCARKVRDGLYRMYYCIILDNYIGNGKPTTTTFDGSWTERAFIGMCETSDPASNKWEDKGFVTCSSSDKGRDGWARTSQSDWNAYFYYNAIDPTYIIDPSGKHYLIYGSWHSGFALLELDAETGKPVTAQGNPWSDSISDLTSRYGVRVGTRKNGNRWQASEAPEVIYKDGWYYLFMAYDALGVPYNTRVVRSDKIEGPYYDITGRNFTKGEGDCYPIVSHPYKFSQGYGWVGVSHCCVFEGKTKGEWFYSSQGRFPENVGGNPASNALMMGQVRRLVWCPASKSEPDNVWPIALPERYGAVLGTDAVKASELIGKWEHIDLSYNYGVQDEARTLNINEDGTLSGAMTGKWSYNAQTKRLTLGDYVVCVEREVDWEASPRCATIVYAGTDKSLKSTLWGKKVDF